MWQDDTIPISLKKYNDAQERFFNYFSSVSGVVCYGTFGSVNAPGLSDLDLVVVVEDECLSRKEFSIPKFQGDENYIFTHAPLVVPVSLLHFLPYYHLINITWANNSPNLVQNDVEDLLTIGVLHVLSKTLYLQSFLWGILSKVNRSCKRSILALTSVAISVQFLQHFSIPVKESENTFVESILSLRADWLSSPENRKNQMIALNHLLLDALKLTLVLPERLAAYLFGFDEGSLPLMKTKERGLHLCPHEFYIRSSYS